MEQDHYAVLRVAPTATPDEIKLAHRERLRACHPDHHAGRRAEEQAKRVNAAWHTLRDPERRRVYDEARAARRAAARRGEHRAVPRPPPAGPPSPAERYDPWAAPTRATPQTRATPPAISPTIALSVARARATPDPVRAVGWIVFGFVASVIEEAAANASRRPRTRRGGR